MAKGTQSKLTITKKILQMFDGAFEYNGGKEIRIPMAEDGQDIQIKVALTCAKDNVEPGDDVALPGEKSEITNVVAAPAEVKHVKPTAEEKQNVSDMLRSLGL